MESFRELIPVQILGGPAVKEPAKSVVRKIPEVRNYWYFRSNRPGYWCYYFLVSKHAKGFSELIVSTGNKPRARKRRIVNENIQATYNHSKVNGHDDFTIDDPDFQSFCDWFSRKYGQDFIEFTVTTEFRT